AWRSLRPRRPEPKGPSTTAPIQLQVSKCSGPPGGFSGRTTGEGHTPLWSICAAQYAVRRAYLSISPLIDTSTRLTASGSRRTHHRRRPLLATRPLPLVDHRPP